MRSIFHRFVLTYSRYAQLHVRTEIVKIGTRSRTVYIEPVFRYRTPKSDRLLARIIHEARSVADTLSGISIVFMNNAGSLAAKMYLLRGANLDSFQARSMHIQSKRHR